MTVMTGFCLQEAPVSADVFINILLQGMERNGYNSRLCEEHLLLFQWKKINGASS